MMRFKQFVAEGKHPLWVKGTAVALTIKVRNLSKQIEREQDPEKQNTLIAQQNKLLGYMNGLGIAVGGSDKSLMRRLARYRP